MLPMKNYRIIKETNNFTKEERFSTQYKCLWFWLYFEDYWGDRKIFDNKFHAESFLIDDIRYKQNKLKEKKIRKAGWTKEVIPFYYEI